MPISKQTVGFLPSDDITAFFDTANVTVNTGFYILKKYPLFENKYNYLNKKYFL